ncbi:MAG: NADH-quinone oxidoreductase subunit NuoN, partial [Pseudomonadota bacterium]
MNFTDPMTYVPLIPELVLIAAAIIILMAGAFARSDMADGLVSIATFVLAAVAGYLTYTIGDPEVTLFNGAFVVDDFARAMKALILAGAAVTLFMSNGAMRELGILSYEYAVLILLSVVGMMVMASASNLLALYMGLELQSFALYVVAALRRDSVKSGEAGLKYFVLGALSSGLLLYGISLVYGFTGTTDFAVIATQLKDGAPSVGLVFGLVFVLAGMAFKISAVPFHMWTPDVYEGAPTPITAFFAAAPKVAAFALLTRLVLTAFATITLQWQQIIIFLSIASMLWGAFAAIGQTNIKRLMAYSSIGHMGFALVGLAAASPEGVQGVVIYMAIYLVMTLGTFACIISMQRDGEPVEEISQLAGLSQTNLPMAVVLAGLMF